MKRSVLRATVLVLVTLVIHLLPTEAPAVSLSPGETAPPFTLERLSGGSASLASYRGRPVVVAFFSTWCSRCASEAAFLRDAFAGREDVAVLLVNQDGEGGAPRERLAGFRDRLALTFPILLDEKLSLWELYGISALPSTVVVDGEGKVVLAEAGFAGGAAGRLLELLAAGRTAAGYGPAPAGKNPVPGDIARDGADPGSAARR